MLTNRGELAHEDVYFFGHALPDRAPYYQVNISAVDKANTHVARSIEVSADHFMPIVPADKPATWENSYMVRGKTITPGMLAFVELDGAFVVANVTSTEVTVRAGLYNPYTLGGRIVVNRVVASSHSSWILDPALDMIGATHLLPAVYQVRLVPVG